MGAWCSLLLNNFMSKIIILSIFTLLSIAVHAQQTAARYNAWNNNAWLMYFGNHKVADKFGLHIEAQIRRNDILKNWQQLLLRTGIEYYMPSARLTLGYGFIETYGYGEFPVANAFPEHRIWQQALLSNPIGAFKLTHRYRLEQRFIGSSATGQFANGRYENRFRYMLRINRALKGSEIERGKFYFSLYNEIFVNFGKEVGYNLFDQNRAYGAIGYHLGKIGRVELGYMYQLLQQRKLLLSNSPALNIIENNHTLQVSLVNDLPFYKKKRGD